MKAVFNANRNLSAELAKDAVVQACRRRGRTSLEACAVLAAWDGRADIGSRGAVLWREAWSRLSSAGVPWTVPFDADRPGQHPARSRTRSDPKVTEALRGAVQDLRAKGIPLDVPLGDKQAEPRGAERIGIPGCSEGEGCFNIISTRRDEQGNYDPFTGSSFVMSAGFDSRGPPERLGDPVLLAVREPVARRTTPTRRGCSRRSSGCRCGSPRPRSRPTRATRGGW